MTADDIIAHCKANLAGYKVPRHVVFGEVPKTSTGKIQKFKLREMAKGRLIGKEADLPQLASALGVLGLNGVTAYFALLDVGRPRPGDTVVVSTAAGSVGSAVGQIAKIAGCRTVGIAGGPVKTQLCTEAFGYDAAIDYKEPKLAGGARNSRARAA